MISILLGVVCFFAMGWWLPAWSRPDTYFAVTVDPAFRDSAAGAEILRRYRLRIGLQAATALLLVLAAPRAAWPWLLPIAVLLQVAGLLWATSRANGDTRRYAVPPAGVREAWLAAEPRPGRLGSLAQAGPFLLLAAAAGFMLANWETIPERFPVHWGVDGRPDRWSARSPAAVFGPILAGGLMCASMLAAATLVERKARRLSPLQHRRVRGVLLACSYLLAVTFAIGAAQPALPWPITPGPIVIVSLVGAAGVLAVAVHGSAAQGARRADALQDAAPGARVVGDGTPDAAWKWGLVYFNPDDPAVFVPKRLGWGYDLNSGRPAAWVFLAGLVAVIAAILALST